MLIDASHSEETRVAITEEGYIHDYDFVTAAKKHIKGNIYLAKVTRVEPSLQAAFVEYGGDKQGFLPFGEIHTDYYQIPVEDRIRLQEEERKARAKENDSYESSVARNSNKDAKVVDSDSESYDSSESAASEGEFESSSDNLEQIEEAGNFEVVSIQDGQIAQADEEEVRTSKRERASTRRYKIQEVIKRGQVVLIQVIKEERGNKGAAVTTFISLPGRYCVLMPNTPGAGGVSRKISDSSDRKRLKDVVETLPISDGMSVIIRTAGSDRSKAEIKRDYEYLIKLWNSIRETTLSSIAPALVYEEGDLIKQSLRDQYNPEIDEILIEGEESYKQAKELMKMIMPSHAAKVKLYKGDVPILHAYGVEEQLVEIEEPIVKLDSGGYIVLNSTEALIAIDVNSGRATGERNIEETATKTNLEAAREIARQIRLRDLAGLIVIDFIDMMDGRNRRSVEKALKESLRVDRAKIQMGRISPFGLLEMTRQRLRPSITESIMTTCNHCQGRGIVRSVESLALLIVRNIELEVAVSETKELYVKAWSEVVNYLANHKRAELLAIEQKYNLRIFVEVLDSASYPGFYIEKVLVTGEKVSTLDTNNPDKKFQRLKRNKGNRKGRFDSSRKKPYFAGGSDYDNSSSEQETATSATSEDSSGDSEKVEGKEIDSRDESTKPESSNRDRHRGNNNRRNNRRMKRGNKRQFDSDVDVDSSVEIQADDNVVVAEATAVVDKSAIETEPTVKKKVAKKNWKKPSKNSASSASDDSNEISKPEHLKADKPKKKSAEVVNLVQPSSSPKAEDAHKEQQPKVRRTPRDDDSAAESAKSAATTSSEDNKDSSRPSRKGWWNKG